MAASQSTLGTWVLLLCAVQLCMAGPLFCICLVQNPGFAQCTVGGDQASFSGFDVDMIELVASYVNWTQVAPGTNVTNLTGNAYTFVCTSLRVAPVIAMFTNPNSTNMDECAMGAGAFTATESRVMAGVRFSWPHLHTSLGVMVASDQQKTEYNPWAFMRPFSWQIWVALIGCAVITPLLLSIFENLIQAGHLPLGMALLTEWRHAIYTMFLCCFNLQVLEVVSAPCQLIIICFAFTNLIFVASYTANLAAVLTASAVNKGIQSIGDLMGKSVAAHSVYVDRLMQNTHIKAAPLAWGGETFFLQVKDMLVSGDLTAYIFDKPLLQYFMGKDDPDCELNLLADTTIEPFDYGIAFHRLMPDTAVRDFSLGVLQAQSTGTLAVLENRYLSSSSGGCGDGGGSSGGSDSLQFSQISGLFIIMGSAAGLGLLISIWSVWHHHYHLPRKAKQAAAQAAAQAGQLKATSMSMSHAGAPLSIADKNMRVRFDDAVMTPEGVHRGSYGYDTQYNTAEQIAGQRRAQSVGSYTAVSGPIPFASGDGGTEYSNNGAPPQSPFVIGATHSHGALQSGDGAPQSAHSLYVSEPSSQKQSRVSSATHIPQLRAVMAGPVGPGDVVMEVEGAAGRRGGGEGEGGALAKAAKLAANMKKAAGKVFTPPPELPTREGFGSAAPVTLSTRQTFIGKHRSVAPPLTSRPSSVGGMHYSQGVGAGYPHATSPPEAVYAAYPASVHTTGSAGAIGVSSLASDGHGGASLVSHVQGEASLVSHVQSGASLVSHAQGSSGPRAHGDVSAPKGRSMTGIRPPQGSTQSLHGGNPCMGATDDALLRANNSSDDPLAIPPAPALVLDANSRVWPHNPFFAQDLQPLTSQSGSFLVNAPDLQQGLVSGEGN